MEPDGKKPMVIAGVALLFVFVVFLKGAPLARFRFILVFLGRMRPNRRAAAAVANGPTTVQTSLRNNWFLGAVFGSPASSSNVDVEQANTAPPPPFDPSISTPSLAQQPPPAYPRYHTDRPYSGAVAHNRPWNNTTFERDIVAVLTQYPPAYTPSLPSSSVAVAPAAVTAH
ncbi:hypothetical protein FRC00_006662 [Tulasnella sp. 408]|nr:hypothetical protein FRC00_006662 [Tulasnella sp. 408]